MIFSKLSLVLLVIFVLFFKQMQAQTPTLFEKNELYGYKLPNGSVLFKPQFFVATDFSKSGIAHVATSDGWKVINSKGKTLFHPFIYDNAPDEFSSGLARFVENEKIGFYNEKGEIIISAEWTFAEPFEGDKAMVCVGCQKVYEGEYYYFEGGDWFHIDKKGNRIP